MRKKNCEIYLTPRSMFATIRNSDKGEVTQAANGSGL